MKEIGRKIREVRKKKKITLDELGEKIGKTQGYLSKLENGKTPISLKNMEIIANALDVDIAEFIPQKEKVINPLTGEEDWLFVIQQLKDKGFTPGEVYLKFARKSIEDDEKKNK